VTPSGSKKGERPKVDSETDADHRIRRKGRNPPWTRASSESHPGEQPVSGIGRYAQPDELSVAPGWHHPDRSSAVGVTPGRREKRRCEGVVGMCSSDPDRLALTRTSRPWGGHPRGCSRPIGVPPETPAPAAQCKAFTTAARSEREGWKFHEIVAFLMRSNGPWSLTSLYSSK